MRIDDIRPYGRNACDNARAIPAVAESIREFGLRGTIGLRSREDPTIVWGHTRVAAIFMSNRGEGVPIQKPPAVEADEFKSAKWDELTRGRDFAPSDAPTLALLCQWHKIVAQATDELDGFGSQTAYQNDVGDLKPFPQIQTLKTASAEIRQLNKQLGIADGHEGEGDGRKDRGTVLQLVSDRRKARVSGA